MTGSAGGDSAGNLPRINIVFDQFPLEAAGVDLARRIADRLWETPEIRTALEAAAGPTTTGRPRLVSGSEGEPVPGGAVILYEKLGTLSLPAPRGGVTAVEAALRGLGGGFHIEPEVTFHTQ